MTPHEAIRRFCTACVGSPFEVKGCGGDKSLNGGCYPGGECLFFKYRLGRGRPSVKLIHKYCRFCMGGGPDSLKLVKACHADGSVKAVIRCELHPYRTGRNPKRAGIGGNFAWKHPVSRVLSS